MRKRRSILVLNDTLACVLCLTAFFGSSTAQAAVNQTNATSTEPPDYFDPNYIDNLYPTQRVELNYDVDSIGGIRERSLAAAIGLTTDLPDDYAFDWPDTTDWSVRGQVNGGLCANPYYYQESCTCASCYDCTCPTVDETSSAANADLDYINPPSTTVGDYSMASAAAATVEDPELSNAAIALAVFAAVLMFCLVVVMIVFIVAAAKGRLDIGNLRLRLRGSNLPSRQGSAPGQDGTTKRPVHQRAVLQA